MKNRINKELISNIEISEDMKNTIYKNCIKGKRTADFRFRYSGVLSALIAVAVFGVCSLGASAAYVGVKARLANMDETEYQNYATEVSKDDFVSTDEGFSRELTGSEIKRIIAMERKYYDENVFPEENMAHYQTKAEMGENELAYIVADNIVYLPEKDMDDEQLLEYIDHDAKKRYVNIRELKEEGIEPGQNMALESTPLSEGSIEYKTRQAGDKFLKEYFGQELNDSWIVLVDIFEEEENRYGEKMTLGILHYYQTGTGYATSYDVYINADDMSLLSIQKGGYGSVIDSKKYTYAEAESFVKECEEIAREKVKAEFGLENPDEVTYDLEGLSVEAGKTATINYEMRFDDRIIYAEVRIEDKEILLLSRF
ncbi:MAG: hypothetical protein K5776_01720 [Lachnospiraceae bacterium]|nr:hypothetical protein [Lachnospiraceae bacterium]